MRSFAGSRSSCPSSFSRRSSCSLVTRVIADAIAAGQQKVTAREFHPPAENGAVPAAAEAAPEVATEPSADEVATAAVEEAPTAVEPAEPQATEVKQ